MATQLTDAYLSICISSLSVLTDFGLMSHICVMKNNSHYPSDACIPHKTYIFIALGGD